MTEEETVEAVARMLASARSHGNVYMCGSHNPLPSEYQTARMFVEDHITSLTSRLRERFERHATESEGLERIIWENAATIVTNESQEPLIVHPNQLADVVDPKQRKRFDSGTSD